MSNNEIAANTSKDTILKSREAQDSAKTKLWNDVFSLKSGRGGEQTGINQSGTARDGGASHLPPLEIYDSKNSGTRFGAPSTKDTGEQPKRDTVLGQNFHIKNNKDYTDVSTDKKTGNTTITHHDDTNESTDSVVRNKDGNLLTRSHDDPAKSTERIYNGKDFTETTVDKTTGNKTYTAYDDTKKTSETVNRDKDGHLLSKSTSQP